MDDHGSGYLGFGLFRSRYSSFKDYKLTHNPNRIRIGLLGFRLLGLDRVSIYIGQSK